MAYQVLARKWRPKSFSELMGQEHVVRALTHALDHDRIHHAFLFTGTRGVGKTTIARIFAKSLNCEKGVGSAPCGECSVCRDVDIGRFIDLLEIDAASRTKVDDTREMLDNVVYAPARGRYKVYLIDEVHMLSGHSFNALLKTLEEPPPHVKFLLATTDPQKLPVTVLSRCLQFNLKRLSQEQIAQQIRKILEAEKIEFDEASLLEIAAGGNGSLRDALSLLDQAISYGGGKLAASEVRTMLGTLDRSQVLSLLESLVVGEAGRVFETIQAIAEYAPDFGLVLDDLANLLHQVQLLQLLPEPPSGSDERLRSIAQITAPEEISLYYQMTITGRRDLGIAPSPRIGFEMALMRLLAFKPGEQAAREPATPAKAVVQPHKETPKSALPIETLSKERSHSRNTAASEITSGSVIPAPVGGLEPMSINDLVAKDKWQHVVSALPLRGPVRELAHHAVPIKVSGEMLFLALAKSVEHFNSEPLLKQFADALSNAIGQTVRIKAEMQDKVDGTIAESERLKTAQRQQEADSTIAEDPFVRQAIRDFDARIISNSTRPVSKETS